jgi:hypothetical protein
MILVVELSAVISSSSEQLRCSPRMMLEEWAYVVNVPIVNSPAIGRGAML